MGTTESIYPMLTFFSTKTHYYHENIFIVISQIDCYFKYRTIDREECKIFYFGSGRGCTTTFTL